MNLILAILLYFQSVSTGQSYTWEQINEIIASQQQNIENVQLDQQQLLQIEQDYGEQASLIDIKNRPQGY